MTGNVIPLFRRVVVTKDGTTYELEQDQTGRPAVEVFGKANAERFGITDATVYEMPDGRRIIARPERRKDD
jgi:RNase P/RNase MRP subunit p29